MAETTIEAGRRGDKLRGDDAKPAKLRLVTRRSRLLGAQGELWPNWRYHSFVTDRHDLDTKAADAYHRNHATVELAIRDLKDNGLRRCPSGRFFANAARLACSVLAHNLARWTARLACSVLAHNLARWTARLGKVHPTEQLTVAAPSATGSSPWRAASSTTQGPPQTAPAAQLALAEHLHHRPGTHPQPAPAHLSRPQRPAQRSPTPPATNPHQPRTPILHAPKRARPHTRTSPAATRPQPPIPQTRRWIQAKRESVVECRDEFSQAALRGNVDLMDVMTARDMQESSGARSNLPSSEASRHRSVDRRTEVHIALTGAMDAWAEPWTRTLAYNLSIFCRLADVDTERALVLVEQMRRLLEVLDGVCVPQDGPVARGYGRGSLAMSADVADRRSFSRGELAARLFGSSHALDNGTVLARWVTVALQYRLGEHGEGLTGCQVWEVYGIRDTRVTVPVLSWGVPAIGESGLADMIRVATDGAMPLHISLYAMLRYPVSVPPGTPVLVVENPRLVEAAAERQLACCVLSANGNPTRSVITLLEQLQQSGASIRCHADFDIWGIAICRRLSGRYDCEPWMMGAAEYEDAIREAQLNRVSLTQSDKKCGATPWDPKLKKVFGKHRLIVHEEFVVDDVLEAFSQIALSR